MIALFPTTVPEAPSPTFILRSLLLIILFSRESIRWVYKDSSGVEQGPFDGLCMQEWYSEGWLEDTLLMKRVEEHDFYTLKDFALSVGNYLEPFLIPQPSLSNSYRIESSSLVSPEHTSWIYRDTNRVEQGPFDGVRMQEWYSMKWLQDNLLIRRIEVGRFLHDCSICQALRQSS